MDSFLSQAQLAGELRLFDIQFAQKITIVNGKKVPELTLAAALAANRLANGDTCAALADVMQFGLYKNAELQDVVKKPPPLNRWRELLLEQKVVGEPGDNHPLILDSDNRLYLGRYWAYEQSLVKSIETLMQGPVPQVDKVLLSNKLRVLFKESHQVDWQCVAAATAVLNRLCVITGGPGTGKTYTVAALLSLLEEQTIDGKPPKVVLAAPTGKAAARLTDSVHASIGTIDSSSAYRDIEAITLHRLLGIWPGRHSARFNSDNPLPYDVVIVDEASMVDLPLMKRTFESLSGRSRLILLGDKDQLASVESGMVLGDICGGLKESRFSQRARDLLHDVIGVDLPAFAPSLNSIADHIVHLQKSYRSTDSGGINALAKSVNAGDVDDSLHCFNSPEFENLSLLPHSADSIDHALREHVLPVYQDIHETTEPVDALKKMSSVCVLCALRKGRSGAQGVNRRVETLLASASGGNRNTTTDYYAGKPVMVTENNTVQNLFNGDHGLVLADTASNELRVHFPGEDGTRQFAPGRLPAHQTFYAMTIHKSQGSEYDTVVIVLPAEDSPMLSRELLYTAITRARKQVIVIANEAQLRVAIETNVVRQSGLADALWPNLPDDSNKDKKLSGKTQADGVPVQTTLDF